jgi:hypothetical protein
MIGCAHVQTTQAWPDVMHRLSIGESVAVTTANEAEVPGKISAVSSESLTMNVDRAPRTFAVKDVHQLRRDGDALWNGLAIGAGVGVLGVLLPDNKCNGQPPRCDDKQIPQRVAFLAGAIAVGVGIDALQRDRTVLYRSPTRVTVRLVPTLSTTRKSITIAIYAASAQ